MNKMINKPAHKKNDRKENKCMLSSREFKEYLLENEKLDRKEIWISWIKEALSAVAKDDIAEIKRKINWRREWLSQKEDEDLKVFEEDVGDIAKFAIDLLGSERKQNV